jgi:hypothetical protein
MFLRIDFFEHILRNCNLQIKPATGNGFPPTILKKKKNKFDMQKCQESIVNWSCNQFPRIEEIPWYQFWQSSHYLRSDAVVQRSRHFDES